MRLLGRRSHDGRSASLIAAMPATRYDPELLECLPRRCCSERFKTDAVDTHHRARRERPRARARQPCTGSRASRRSPFRELEQELIALTRTWDDGLREQLARRLGTTAGRELAARWAPRFPRYYKASVEPSLAIADVLAFERLERDEEPFVVDLQNEPERTRVALYKRGGKVELSEVMPMLEDLGLRVIEEVPTRLRGGDEKTWVQDFGVLGPDDRPLDLDAVGERVADCIAAVRRGDTESDSLNRLVIVAGLDWRQVNVLRAYRMYRQRIGSRFTAGLPERRARRQPGRDGAR